MISKGILEGEGLLTLLKTELAKQKKDAMFITGTTICVLIPILVIIKDKFLSAPPTGIMDWAMSYCLVTFFVLAVLSGFVMTNSIQKEYQSGTLINVFCSSVSRMSFVLVKLAVWFLWYVMMLIYIEIIAALGGRFLYPTLFSTGYVKWMLGMFTEFGVLSFITFIPLLWIAILQRKLFYPALLVTLGFSGILLGGFNISTEMMMAASFIPWTAVSLVSIFQVKSPYVVIGMISILLTGTLGVLLALRSAYRQDH